MMKGTRIRAALAAAVCLCGAAAAAGQTPVPASIVLEGAPARGAADARATIATFTDFGNPAAASTAVILQGLVEEFKDQVRIVFKHALPANRPDRLLVHEAARAAGAQGQFWPMHDLLLGNQGRHGREDLVGMAAQLKLDVARFTADLDAGTFREAVEKDRQEAEAFRATGRPVWYLNGARLEGPVTLAELSRRVKAALATP